MKTWREVWREGIAPQMSRKALAGLLEALERDDPRLVQGTTTIPPPLFSVQDWPVEGGCGIGYCGAVENGGLVPAVGWDGPLAYDANNTFAKVGAVEEYFARVCYQCDQAINEPAGCRHFLNWFDDTPRDQMILELIPEVAMALCQKGLEETNDNRAAGHEGE
jgi:hypothetical protein